MKWVISSVLVVAGCGSTVTIQADDDPHEPGTGGAATTVSSGGAPTGMGDGGEAPPPLPNPCEDGSCARAFVSSERYTANLGGLEGADAKCQALADAAGMNGVFKAWLSSVAVSVGERLAHHQVPFVLVDGTTIADDWDDLVVPILDARISLDEHGQQVPFYDSAPEQLGVEEPLAWTGSHWDGTSTHESDYCGGPAWASDEPPIGNAIVGHVRIKESSVGNVGMKVLDNWAGQYQAPHACTIRHHLYCLEQ